MNDENLDRDELLATAREIADRVMNVKSEWDRVGGLYEMALKGATAGILHERWTRYDK